MLKEEVDLRAVGPDFVAPDEESDETLEYREGLHAEGVPSETVAVGYRWAPGTELTQRGAAIATDARGKETP